MTKRRRRDGEHKHLGPGAGGPGEPRVQGAWDTPAVVVRRPDGSIVPPGWKPAPSASSGARTSPTREDSSAGNDDSPARPSPPDQASDPPTRPAASSAGVENEQGQARPRVRPRRIPGAPGAVLVRPTLRPDAGDGRVERRQRRLAAPSASVTPLSRRPSAGGEDGEQAAGRVSGEPRTQRVLQAVAAINRNLTVDRLLPADEEARQRLLAGLRRVGTRVASITLAGMLVYAVFPVRTYLNQRAATERAREQIEVLTQENDRLEQRAEDLRDPETVEEIARRELGLVKPGEESYGIFPAPEDQATTTTVPPG